MRCTTRHESAASVYVEAHPKAFGLGCAGGAPILAPNPVSKLSSRRSGARGAPNGPPMSSGSPFGHYFNEATRKRRHPAMKFLLQMIADESYWENLSPEEMQPMIEAMDRYNDELKSAGAWVHGEGLDFSGTAKTVRPTSDGGRNVTDGPFSNSKEQFGGFWIIEAPTMDDAVEWAKKVPMSVGGIEVRPILDSPATG